MRTYFWKYKNVKLKGWNETYQSVLEKTDEEDVCLMIHNENDVCVGYIIMNWINERGGSAGMDLMIFPEYRRQGYGTMAMEVMLEYAFEERRLHKLHMCTKSNGVGEEHFLYQLGFVFEAYRKDMFLIDGAFVTEYYFGMTEQEYRAKERKEKYHEQAPKDYMQPLYNGLGAREGEVDEFSYVPYEKQGEYYFCNGLTFRPMQESDYLENRKIIFDSQICRWYDDDVKIPVESTALDEFEKKHLNYQMEDSRLEFAIEDENGYVGCVNLCGIEREHHRTSGSYYLTPRSRRKGYATKALQFALSYAAKELGCDMFFTCVSDGNIASASLLTKLGMHMCGVQREASFVGGKYVDTLFFGNRK